MKKCIYSLLMGALLAGCAANEPGTNDPNQNGDNAEVQGYLSINIVAPGGTKTKAGNDNYDLNDEYEYGTTDENYIQSVRLYFFNDADEGVVVRKNPAYDNAEDNAGQPEGFSYYDWYPTPGENDDPNNYPGDYEAGGTFQDPNNSGELEGETIEKMVNVIVALTAKDANFPTKVAAIINPTDEIKNITKSNPTPSLSQLMGDGSVLDNFTGLTSKGKFVMSSSVYVGGDDNNIIITQPIDEDVNLGFTQQEAQAHPINIYVERVLARLDLDIDMTEVDDDTYSTQETITTEDRKYDVEGEDVADDELTNADIYVKFLGWAVTSTPTKSNVIKNISLSWGDAEDLFGLNQPWFIPAYHRSFWAYNPVLEEADPGLNPGDYVWYNYNQLTGLNNTTRPATTFPMSDEMSTYMQENANPNPGTTAANPNQPTKVIFAAQLVKEDGKPVTLAQWNGIYFTFTGLRNLAAKMLDMYYLVPGTDADPQYKPITGKQITFMTASQFYPNSGPLFSESPNYTVYATLTSDAQGADPVIDNAANLQWYHLNDNINPDKAQPSDYTKLSASQIPAYMQQVFGSSMVWNNGYTYYYYTIRHLGQKGKPGYEGVVRNHIYNSTVDGLKGLGTPVWDPTEPIYPEKPEDNGTNLSVKINVLSWRLVTDAYEFEW